MIVLTMSVLISDKDNLESYLLLGNIMNTHYLGAIINDRK